MFVTQEVLVKRATRLMNRDVSVKSETIKPDAKSVVWYPEMQVLWFDDKVHNFYVGELHMRCDGLPDQWSAGFKNWLWVFGIKPDGTLEVWSN